MSEHFANGHALLIGVTDCKVQDWSLPQVARDIAALRAVLVHPARCAYPVGQVKTIADEAATRRGILDGLEWLAGQAAGAQDATAVVYFSGHAFRSEGGVYFLLPYDVSPGRLHSRALRAEDFAAAIAGLAPRRLLVILDCCHAAFLGVKGLHPGAAFASAALPPAMVMPAATGGAAAAKGLEGLSHGQGRAILTSSQGSQRSYVRRDGKMSIFTYHLIEALTGHAQPATGAREVLVSDVMGHVARRVPGSARLDWGEDQQPDFVVTGNFPVALIAGGKGLGVTPAPDPLAPLPTTAPAEDRPRRSLHVARDLNVQGDFVMGDKIDRQINTGGGAYIEGDADCS